MKTFLITSGLAAMVALAIFAGAARAQDAGAPGDGVSFQTFYDQLAQQGTWIKSDDYGYVWQPSENDSNWRPYMYGHWVNTDQGLTWVSDEPFGWATYHYGRWTNLAGYGWVWVPGYTWAPAWVSWRDGDDEVGWAPLPPASDQGIDYYSDDDYFTGVDFGFHIGDDCDVAYGIGPLWYNFCPIAFIGDRDCWRHFRDRRDNFTLLGHTRNVTNINFRRDGAGRFGRVRAEGPSVAALNARANTPIAHARLTSVSRPGEAGLRGDRLGVFAPRVNASTFRTARPSHIAESIGIAGVNRGNDLNRPLAVNSHVGMPAATSDQVRAARVAPSNPRLTLNQPLASMRTTPRGADEFGAVRMQHRTVAPVNDSSYAGQIVPRSTFSSNRESPVMGEGFHSQMIAPGGNYRRSSIYSYGAPALRSPSIYGGGAPAFRPQESFRSMAPHFGGGMPAARGTVPAFSGGGASHASPGGGHSGGHR